MKKHALTIKLSLLLVATTFSTDSFSANKDCERFLKKSHADRQLVDKKTMGAIEALRSLPVSAEIRINMEFFLRNDSYLKEFFTGKDTKELATKLLDPKHSHRTAEHWIGRALVEKDPLYKSLKASAKPKFALDKVDSSAALAAGLILKEILSYINKDWSHMDQPTQTLIADFLRNSVLSDPQFQETPVAYLENWNAKRGGLEMLMIPEDPALDFLRSLHSQNKLIQFASAVKALKEFFPQNSDNVSAEQKEEALTSLRKSVGDYVDLNWSHLGPESAQTIKDHLFTKIFPDPEFKKAPMAYLTAWQKKRGGLQMLMIPEDASFAYFSFILRNELLDELMKAIKTAGI